VQAQTQRLALGGRGDRTIAIELAPQPALAGLRLPGDLLGAAFELGARRGWR
jgi:hypothetical protein